jgi:hypothetical protein
MSKLNLGDSLILDTDITVGGGGSKDRCDIRWETSLCTSKKFYYTEC